MVESFIRWSLRYDLWCKMTFFGDDIRREMEKDTDVATRKRGPNSLLALLPDEFSYQDAVRIRQSKGLDEKGTKGMLYQWVHRKYLTVLTDDRYKKA